MTPPHAPPPKPSVTTLCGPDITEFVLAVMRKMKEEFDNLQPKDKDIACGNLINPKYALKAWDIGGLDPETSPGEGDEFDPETNDWIIGAGKARANGAGTALVRTKGKFSHRHFWLEGISAKCAIPRPQCSATVEFMGTCQHAQVVNYFQWGMMRSICTNHIGPTWGPTMDAMKATYTITSPNAEAQNALVDAGSDYGDALNAQGKGNKGNGGGASPSGNSDAPAPPGPSASGDGATPPAPPPKTDQGATPASATPGSDQPPPTASGSSPTASTPANQTPSPPDYADIAAALKKRYEDMPADRAPARECLLHCRLTDVEKRRIGTIIHGGFTWTGMPGHDGGR